MTITKVTAYTELIGADEKVDQNEWCASANVAITLEKQGITIHSFLLKQGFDGAATGVALAPTGTVVFFKGNPSLASGTAIGGLSAAQLALIVGAHDVVAGDWNAWMAAAATTDASLAIFHLTEKIDIPRMANDGFYVAFLYTGATSFNSAAGDEETLEIKLVYS